MLYSSVLFFLLPCFLLLNATWASISDYQVGIRPEASSSVICGAALISRKHVLTSADCMVQYYYTGYNTGFAVLSLPDNTLVEYRISTNVSGYYKPSRFDYYGPEPRADNLVIITLEKEVELDLVFSPLALSPPAAGVEANIGTTAFTTQSLDYCRARLLAKLSEQFLCATEDKPAFFTVYNGSPLTVKKETGESVIVGVWNFKSVFADVAFFADFITKVFQEPENLPYQLDLQQVHLNK